MPDPLIAPFETTLSELHLGLGAANVPYMVMEDAAVLVHDVARMNRGIDVTILYSPEDADDVLAALPAFSSLVVAPVEFAADTRVLPMEGPDGTRVDLIFARLPFEVEAMGRAREEVIGSSRVRVCAAEDLIVMKILSNRPRDLREVAGIVAGTRDTLDRARLGPLIAELATELDRPEILENWRRITGEG